MSGWFGPRGYGPIGLDLGTRSLKMLQFSASGDRLIDAAKWDFPLTQGEVPSGEKRAALLAEALHSLRKGHGFRGREVALCVNDRELFTQNVRVPKCAGDELRRLVHQEVAGRLPYSIGEAEIDFLESADVRQGEATLREVIVLACHRPLLDSLLGLVEKSGLKPVSVDVEPNALLRNYVRQLRREEDTRLRTLYVHMGYAKTAVVIAQGDDVLFLKYLDLGGIQFDKAVARKLELDLADAAALRRTNGDRRAESQDPEIARLLLEASRPVTERLASELAMCVRYHSVTFRGHPLVRFVLGGGEASPPLLEQLAKRLDLKAELSDPFRAFPTAPQTGRRGQWDVAAGLACRGLK